MVLGRRSPREAPPDTGEALVRVLALVVKRRNAVNAPLFVPGPTGLDRLNPYARILADEALRRGIRSR